MKSGVNLLKEIANDLASEHGDDDEFLEILHKIIEAAWETRYHPLHTELENRLKELIEEYSQTKEGDNNED